MLKIIKAEYKENYEIWLEFNDETKGIVDLSNELWGEVFEPLKNKNLFKNFNISEISNTIEWFNGADLAPEFLYNKIKSYS
jgi:hypothetical protein